jgi:outer membrane protein TolC
MSLKKIFILICLGLVSVQAAMTQDIRHLTLKDALQSVDTANLQVLMANARLEQAIARIAQAESVLMPHLEGDVNGGRQTADLRAQGVRFPGLGPRVGPFNNFDARGRVTMALFDLSAFERFRAAKKGENLSQAQLQKTREDVLALVAQLFVDAQRKQQTARLYKALLDRDRMSYLLGAHNLNQGTGTVLEYNRFKSEFDETKYLFDQAQYQAQEAFLDLGAALQLPAGAPLELADDSDFLKILEENTAADFHNASSADMVVASSQLEASQADQNTAATDFLPKVSGSADYGRSGQSPGHGSNTYFVGLQATVPIWEGGAQQAKLKEAKGHVKEAQANVLDAAQQQKVNIAKARAAIAEADDLKEAKTQKRRTYQRALQIALHSQQIGSGSVFQLVQTKANLAKAEDEYNEAQATWVMAHIDLLHAEGRLRELITHE